MMEEPFLNLRPGYKKRIGKFLSNQIIRFIVFGGFFLLIVILMVLLFWYQNFVFQKFVKYSPVDSVVYISLRNSFWPWQNTSLIDSPAAKDFSDQMQQSILPSATHAAIAITPIDSSLEKIYYFYLKDKKQAIELASEYRFTQIIDDNILVIADSGQSLFKLQEVYQNNLQSLENQVNTDLVGRNTLNYYLDSDNVKAYVAKQDNIISKIFTYLSHDDIYISGSKRSDHWRFNFDNEFSDLTPPVHVIQSLPQDFSIYIPGVDFSSIISLWQSIDQKLAYDLNQNAKNLEIIYNFHSLKEVKDLFNQQADLVIFDNSDNFLGFNYVLAMNNFTNQQLEAFEEFIKIILAQKLPSQVSYILPDGSQVTELIANTNQWQWHDMEDVRYLSEPKLNFNINYKIKEGKLYVSSSKSLLDRFDDNNVDPIRLTSRCGFSVSNSIGLLINNPSKFSSLLPTGLLALSQKSDNRVGGCTF